MLKPRSKTKHSERGASLVEGALLLALVSVVAIFSVQEVGYAIGGGRPVVERAGPRAADGGPSQSALGIFARVGNALGRGEAEVKPEDEEAPRR